MVDANAFLFVRKEKGACFCVSFGYCVPAFDAHQWVALTTSVIV